MGTLGRTIIFEVDDYITKNHIIISFFNMLGSRWQEPHTELLTC